MPRHVIEIGGVLYAGGSALSSGGGITRSVNSTSGNVSAGAAANTDYVYFITGAHTVTLPTAVGNTNRYTFVRTGASTGSIATTSSQTINGAAAPLDIVQQWAALSLISNGTNWVIVNY